MLFENDKQKAPIYVVQNLLTGRVCILTIALLLNFYSESIFENESFETYLPNLSYTILACFFAFTALSCIWYLKFRSGLYFLLSQIFFDSLCVSTIVFVSGGINSSFTLFYLLLVLSSSLFAGFILSLIYIAFNLLGFIFATYFAGFYGYAEKIDSYNYDSYIESLSLLLSMLCISLGVHILKRNFAKTSSALELRLVDFGSRQKLLMEEINSPIIITDTNYLILEFNQEAKEILTDLKEGRNFNIIIDAFSTKNNIIEINSEDELKRYKISKKFIDAKDEKSDVFFYFLHEFNTEISKIEEETEKIKKILNLNFRDPKNKKEIIPGFVAGSDSMQAVFKLIFGVSKSSAAVLISGESGTGKELVAKSIHNLSDRNTERFVSLNCGAIPAELIESELFGHKKGSFTGATTDREGLFFEAGQGTIFLDEIGELPLNLQVKLLRVLQERKFRPVGSNKELSLNARVISATNRNLNAEIRNGAFREDLYYRIKVVEIALPPLRERKEDLPILLNSILIKLGYDPNEIEVKEKELRKLYNYNYPGNIREFENIIERALVFGGDELKFDFLDSKEEKKLTTQPETQIVTISDEELPLDLDELLSAIEESYLKQALSITDGVRTEAAKLLGMNTRSFRYRLSKYDIGE